MHYSRRTQIIMTFSFLVLLALPHLMELSGKGSNTAANEKRHLATRPPIGLLLTSFPEYARRFERFYNDSFGLRDALIRWNNRLRLLLFGESPVRGVRAGRDGWFFYADEWVLEDYENAMPFKPQELNLIASNLEERRAWLERQGIHLVVLAIPEKHTIYGEYLPPAIHKIGRESRLDQLAKTLEAHPAIDFVDARDALLKAKSVGRLYHRTDSHWNDLGAFFVYRELTDHLAHRFPQIPRHTLEDYTVSTADGTGGDLSVMLSLSDVIGEERITLIPRFTPRAEDATRPYPDPVDPAVYPGRDMVVKETRDTALPKILVFRDSFSSALIPFLAESFQSAVFVWTHEFLPELIEQEKPDIVVIECVERYLNALSAQDPPEVTAGSEDDAHHGAL